MKAANINSDDDLRPTFPKGSVATSNIMSSLPAAVYLHLVTERTIKLDPQLLSPPMLQGTI